MRRRSGLQDDYVLRIIREAGEALARLRARLLGADGTPDSLRRDAASAIQMLLGNDAPMLSQLDAATAVWLAGSAERVDVWAALLDIEADAILQAGDATLAASRHARAKALRDASAILSRSEQ